LGKEEIEEMNISPVTTVQLERILNYLAKNEEYAAKFNNLEIRYQGYYEGKEENIEMFTIYRKKEE
jgi:hypothetical protein